ncbi:MAG: sugar phosphate isomerase/epimerase [Steroidobacteraceae bacterium]
MKNTSKLAASILSRREFVGGLAIAAGAGVIAPTLLGGAAFAQSPKPNSLIRGVQIGVITYSFRSMPDQSAQALLRYCIESGVSAIELMGDPAEVFAGLPPNPNAERLRKVRTRDAMTNAPPLIAEEQKEKAEVMAAMAVYQKQTSAWRATAQMPKFVELRKLFNDAGVSIYGFKPSAFEVSSTDAEIDYGMRAAKALGASHVTVELPTDTAHAARLGAAALKHGILVGYHQHLQATPTLWDAALTASKGNGINLDLGHFTAAGEYDGVAFMRNHADRITSMHLKDRRTKSNGQANLPWGTGDTPVVAALKTMRDQKFRFPATIELEYDIPAGSDAVKEVRKCLDYCRKALEA